MTDAPDPQALATRYRARLIAERDGLHAAGTATGDDRRPVALDQSSVGRLSRMDAMQQQAMAAAQHARRQARGREIAAALARLDSAEFGWCEDCGAFIGLARLDLDPALRRCIGCAR